jgi:hypothetical protein
MDPLHPLLLMIQKPVARRTVVSSALSLELTDSGLSKIFIVELRPSGFASWRPCPLNNLLVYFASVDAKKM